MAIELTQSQQKLLIRIVGRLLLKEQYLEQDIYESCKYVRGLISFEKLCLLCAALRHESDLLLQLKYAREKQAREKKQSDKFSVKKDFVGCRVSKQMYEQMQERAAEKNCSVSDLVREALSEFYEDESVVNDS